jgi:cytoskeletal protein CcmA (bactofilin family)
MKKTKIKDQMNGFLGKDTEFEGKLSFGGVVRVDGRFTGEIFTEGTLVVGESAVIEADIQVTEIIVSGEIRGNIFAKKRIEIHPPGKIFGDIQAPVIAMDEGVIFEGNCKVHKQAQEGNKKVAVLPQSPELKK